MSQDDTLNVKILEDGTLVVETDKISTGNHRSADELIATLTTMMGGQVKRRAKTKRNVGHTHVRNQQRA
tara:strand:- start:612 stop:818 length:207 start_codon:yes stop_codon:yes gene_type:complete